MPIRVTVAGRVGVEVDGAPVDGSRLGRPGRLALAYLACERRRPVRRDELADVLWGEDLPASWEQMLRGVTHKLRAVLSKAGLDPTTLKTGAGTYELRLSADATVDVEEAAAALESAVAALVAGDSGAAESHARAAVEIAGARFAPGLSGDWIERRQEELRALHLEALETLARALLHQARWSEAVSAADAILGLEPFRESGYLVLMDAHAGAGRRAEALRTYERCREALADQLGVSPSPSTESAYLRLLGDDPTGDAPHGAAIPLPPALSPIPGSFVVGREAEAERLAAAFKRARVEGRQAVVVAGEPGIGKTTLVAEAARAAHAQGARVLYGRCDEELGVPYQAFAQALGHYVANCPLHELRAHAAAHGGVLARLVPSLARRVPEAVPPASVDPETDRWALFEAVTELLGTAASATPVVLVLDDLHWAAAASLLLLRHVLANANSTALLVVATYRDSEVDSDHPLAATLADLRRLPAVERLTLRGLDDESVAAFVAATREWDDTAAELARTLKVRTAGNPFFLGEVLRDLAEDGHAAEGSRAVPESVADVVLRRVARLTPAARDAIVIGSVVGIEFDLDVVERLVPDQAPALDAVEACVDARLLVERPDPPGRFVFAHALVRDAVYRRLSGLRRARLHRRVGETVELLHGNDAAWFSSLAYHFAEAASVGSSVKAADYGLAAGRAALDEGAPEHALKHLERGLESLDCGDSNDWGRRLTLLLALGRAMLGTRDARVPATLARAAEAARRLESVQALAEVAWTFAPQARRDGIAVTREALAAVGDGSPALRARLLSALATGGGTVGEDYDNEISEALVLARAGGDEAVLGKVFGERCCLLLGSSNAAGFLAAAEEMVASTPARLTEEWQPALHWRATARLVNGDRSGFDEDVGALELRAQGNGNRALEFEAISWRVSQALLDGRFDAADKLITIAQGGVAAYNYFRWFKFLRKLIQLRWDQGRVDEVERLARSGLERSPRFPVLHTMLGLARFHQGDRQGAWPAHETVMATLADVPVYLRPEVFVRAAELAVEVGDCSAAARVEAALRPFAGLMVPSHDEALPGSADRYLGMLAAVLSRRGEAATRFEAALSLETRLAAPSHLARTQYWYARSIADDPDGDRRRAAALAAESAASAERLGMALLAQQAKAVHARVSASPVPEISPV